MADRESINSEKAESLTTSKNCRVEDIAAAIKNALVGGPFGSNLVSADYVVSGIPVIRGQNMSHGRWIGGAFVYVSEEKADRLSANIARPGDLIFTQRGTLGQVAIVPDKPFDRYLVSQSQMKLTADSEKADPVFLYYVFSSQTMVDHILRDAIQTGVPHTNLEILRKTPLRLPAVAEQSAIARILGTLDDKIELNRRMNETLEAMARAIFKSWFVDFDPVHAKAEGHQPFGMNAATAALFPDSFQDSALCNIPRGWRAGKAEEIVSLCRDTINPGDHPDELFDHYSIPAFDEARFPKAENGAQIKSNKFTVPGNTVLLSKLNPRIPRVWLPKVSTDHRSVASTEFLVAASKGDATPAYLYTLFSSESFLDTFATMVTGTSGSHQRVKPEYLLEMQVVIPTKECVRRLTEVVEPLLGRVSSNLGESRALAAIRDALLPKLLSGEIRVGKIGKLAEADAK